MDSDASMGDYEVFLSFRGADTRQGFTAILYEYMTMAEIRVFRDDDELAIGDEIDSILKAIDSSTICIPIFSPRFAESKWCLREVSRMVELEKTIVPVFYKVSPDDVKLKTSLYSDAFKKLEESHGNHEEIAKWKNALKKAASIKGRELGEKSYPKYCKELVDEVLSKLGPRTRLEIDQFVGVHNKASALELLDIGSSSEEVVFVGMHGMGGIGKTTLTKLIYNEFLSSFDHCSFVPDIREYSRSKGVNGLPQYLFENLQPKPVTPFTRSEQIPGVFKNKKVLIILDDVDSYEQIKKIAREPSWFGSGSRIILTTRDKKVLDDYRVESRGEIRYLAMEGLPSGVALELFSKRAFGIDSPPSTYQDLSKRAVSYAGGLPLAITVIAKYLRNKREKVEWEDIIERLKRTPPKEVKDILMISYEALEDEHKKIFLDIACVFIGEEYTETSNVFYMWQACELFPRLSLEILQSRSLVEVVKQNSYSRDQHSYVGVLWMHDQLRDLGRDIVRSKCEGDLMKQSRLWEHNQVADVLKCKKKQKNKIELLPRFWWYDDTDVLFANFDNLRYLCTSILQGDFSSLLPQLRWLSCKFIFEARNLSPSNLVILDLSWSKVDENWDILGEIQVLKKLKVLNLGGCDNLRRTPVFAENMALERLDLGDCTSLAYIHPSIGNLHNLNYLCLSACFFLHELPDSIGLLANLERLDLSCCKKIQTLPDSLGKLKSLQELKLKDSGITELPHSLGKLKSLQELKLKDSRITELPESIGGLEKLKELVLSTTCISQLPDSIGFLANLERLDLSFCKVILTLPDSLGKLKSLQKLELTESGIFELPESIGGLEKLKELVLSTTCISQLPDSIGLLANLERLDLSFCEVILTLPDSLGKLKSLQELDLTESGITELPESIGGLEKLKELDLSYSKISQLPSSINLFSVLQTLILDECDHLQELPELPTSLKKLVGRSNVLNNVPNLGNRQDITTLEISDDFLTGWNGSSNLSLTINLKSISTLPNLSSNFSQLIQLELIRQHSLKALPDLSGLRKLLSLWIESCNELIEIPGIGKLKSLTDLCIIHCPSLVSLENLRELQALNKFELLHCGKLTQIPGLGELRGLIKLSMNLKVLQKAPIFAEDMALEELILDGCLSLAYIDLSIGKLQHLNYLSFNGCKNLENLPESLGNLHFLRELNLGGTSITTLPDSIGSLEKLERLNLRECGSLVDLPQSLGGLEKLEELVLSGSKISQLPSSIHQLSLLKILKLKGCKNLENLPESLGNLHSLRELNLGGTSITTLPDSIGSLEKLERLNLSECGSLVDLPQSLGGLEKLEELVLSGSKISQLPSSINQLSLLKILKLKGCKNLENLPESLGNLHSLRELNLGGTSITTLPDSIGSLEKLERLNLSECGSLVDLPQSLGNLRSMVSLDILQTKITKLPPSIGELEKLESLKFTKLEIAALPYSIGLLANLKWLGLFGCKKIQTLPHSLGKLKSLQELELRYSGITELPESIGGLQKLKELLLSGSKISQLPSSINWLPLLQTLNLDECDHLQELPELPTSLKVLDGRSDVLNKVPNLGNRQDITLLSIIGGSISGWNGLSNLSLTINLLSISTLPNLSSNFSKLILLILIGCEGITAIPGIGKLQSLTHLRIEKCPSLVSLENLGELKELRQFNLIRCQRLAGIPGLGELRSLTELSVEDCDSLESLENIKGLEVLKHLRLTGCRKLTEIPGLVNLKSLRMLNIRGCYSGEILGSASQLEKLHGVKVFGMPNSEECQLLGLDMSLSVHYSLGQASCSGHGNLATQQSEVEDSPRRKRKRDWLDSPEEGRLKLRLFGVNIYDGLSLRLGT